MRESSRRNAITSNICLETPRFGIRFLTQSFSKNTKLRDSLIPLDSNKYNLIQFDSTRQVLRTLGYKKARVLVRFGLQGETNVLDSLRPIVSVPELETNSCRASNRNLLTSTSGIVATTPARLSWCGGRRRKERGRCCRSLCLGSIERHCEH
jgi:hypothetical protein